jgi:hypothetical protein
MPCATERYRSLEPILRPVRNFVIFVSVIIFVNIVIVIEVLLIIHVIVILFVIVILVKIFVIFILVFFFLFESLSKNMPVFFSLWCDQICVTDRK